MELDTLVINQSQYMDCSSPYYIYVTLIIYIATFKYKEQGNPK